MIAKALTIAVSAVVAAVAHAEDRVGDEYLCSVREKAGIATLHHEDAPPPKAFTDRATKRFALRLSEPTGGDKRFLIIEIAYEGPDRDKREYQTPNALLHSKYVGDGRNFTAVEDQGFLRLIPINDTRFEFYHSGFEYPGGEDADLSVRWGACERRPTQSAR